LVILVVAIGLSSAWLGDALTTEFGFTNDPDSQRADKLLEERLRGPKKANDIVVVKSDTLTVDDPAFKQRVESLFQQLIAVESVVDLPAALPQNTPEGAAAANRAVSEGTHYYQFGLEPLVSADRHTTIIPLVMAGEFNDATSNMEETILDLVREANGEDGFKVLIAGESSIAAESNEIASSEIERGERIAVPVALIILLLLFGAVLAALLPILLAIVAIIVALGATAILGQFVELIFFVTLMISMIGLAVGIDYSLIVVSRFREELRRGLDKVDAIARTGATASRTVFFSGVTVVLALAGLLIVPSTIYQALGIGAIFVVISAVAAALTLLPAVLSIMGTKVNALRVPLIGRLSSGDSGDRRGGFWDWTTRNVMRYPVISLILSAGVLVAAGISLFDIKVGANGVDTFPDAMQSKEAFLILDEEFSFGEAAPTEIAIDGDVNSTAVQGAIERLQDRLRSDPDFVGRSRLQVNPAGDLALLTVAIAGEPASDQAIEAVERLRNEYIHQAFAGVDAEALVTGFTAFNVDFFDIAERFTPIVFAVVLSLSFVLLTVVFRSIVLPIKAILMNLLSVGAAYGLLVLVFQKGVGADLLGFQKTPVIDAWIPLFLFSVLFGLSMDYHVFLLSRIRERYDQTHDNAEAVAYGLRATAGLITGAALIMVAVFGGFASGDLVSNQQFGFGLGVAVFLDATIVRTVLVPSSMRLLGDFNWYLPGFLKWLPDLRVEAESLPEPVAAPPPTPGAANGGGDA
jgi:RND superfamily putative drug exporter